MSWKTALVLSRRCGKPVLLGLAAALLLAPVPALAFTFTGSWVATFSQTGGPTPAQPTFTDRTSGSGHEDDLFVDMQEYQGATAPAASTIQLSRSFRVQDARESLELSHEFATYFAQGGATVTVAVKDTSGTVVATPLTFDRSTSSSTFTAISDDQERELRLGRGNYSLVVTVTYKTNNKLGGWKRKKSQHHFQFEGEGDDEQEGDQGDQGGRD
jgi:hypothetical protein